MNFLLFCRKKLMDLQIQQTQRTTDLSFLGACGNKVWTWISTLSLLLLLLLLFSSRTKGRSPECHMKETNDKVAMTKLWPLTLNEWENSTKRISYKVTAWTHISQASSEDSVLDNNKNWRIRGFSLLCSCYCHATLLLNAELCNFASAGACLCSCLWLVIMFIKMDILNRWDIRQKKMCHICYLFR